MATSNPTVRTGSPVSFRVEIRRVGSRPCLADGSEAGRAVVIMSGSARVWSSADCSTGSRMLLLGAGDVDVQTVTWNGKTSAPNCGGPRAIAGAGTYSVAAELAGVQGSAGEPLTLTITAPPPPPTPTAPATGTGTPSGPTASATGTGTPSGPAASAPAAKPGPAASAPADPAKP